MMARSPWIRTPNLSVRAPLSQPWGFALFMSDMFVTSETPPSKNLFTKRASLNPCMSMLTRSTQHKDKRSAAPRSAKKSLTWIYSRKGQILISGGRFKVKSPLNLSRGWRYVSWCESKTRKSIIWHTSMFVKTKTHKSSSPSGKSPASG